MDSQYIKYKLESFKEYKRKSTSSVLTYESGGEFEDLVYNECINNFQKRGKNLALELFKEERNKELFHLYSEIEKINE